MNVGGTVILRIQNGVVTGRVVVVGGGLGVVAVDNVTLGRRRVGGVISVVVVVVAGADVGRKVGILLYWY